MARSRTDVFPAHSRRCYGFRTICWRAVSLQTASSSQQGADARGRHRAFQEIPNDQVPGRQATVHMAS
jgi:hypothetical protein